MVKNEDPQSLGITPIREYSQPKHDYRLFVTAY